MLVRFAMNVTKLLNEKKKDSHIKQTCISLNSKEQKHSKHSIEVFQF